jgi:hypothetical protein
MRSGGSGSVWRQRQILAALEMTILVTPSGCEESVVAVRGHFIKVTHYRPGR